MSDEEIINRKFKRTYSMVACDNCYEILPICDICNEFINDWESFGCFKRELGTKRLHRCQECMKLSEEEIKEKLKSGGR